MKSLLEAHSAEFESFSSELMKWSKTHNLTAYKTREKIIENITDSIYPLEFICDFKNALDIGSGGGFPAIPLAIAKRESNFHLIEPNAKKVAFLRVLTMNLGLKNVFVYKTKIDDFKSEKRFDLITSRALFETEKLIAQTQNILNKNGYFLFYKGEHIFKESLNGAKITKFDCIIRRQRLYFYKSKKEVCDG